MTRRRWFTVAVVAALAVTACAGSDDDSGDSDDLSDADPGDCITVDMAVSSEKIALLTQLANDFNDSEDAEVEDGCVFVRPYSKASGGAAPAHRRRLAQPGGQWHPTGDLVARRIRLGRHRQRTGRHDASPRQARRSCSRRSSSRCPSRWPKRSGIPTTPIGFADIVELANDPEGWASLGHPEWGPFRLGKTNPNYSTSGLNFTIAEYYAATGKTRGLTTRRSQPPGGRSSSRANVESAVVHYGDITMTFLNNWFATDVRGTSLTYASAVAVEEKCVIDYNLGNPDGVLPAGETPRAPRVPLVAIYPSEGTLFSDNPFIVLNTEWVTPEQKVAAPRSRNTSSAPRTRAGARVRVPPEQPQRAARRRRSAPPTASTRRSRRPSSKCPRRGVGAASSTPGPSSAKRHASCSCSTSRARWASRPPTTRTKLDLAKEAAVSALDQFKEPTRSVCGCSPPISAGRRSEHTASSCRWRRSVRTATCSRQIMAQFPTNGTPLYDVTESRTTAMLETYDPAQDQRRRVPHRRRQRRRQPRRRRRSVRRA